MAGLATIQDFGRRGHLSDGVPVGGAMDAASLASANALVQNRPDAAGIEWALAGGAVRFLSRARIGISGANADVTLNGSRLRSNTAANVAPGDEIAVTRFRTGSFLYLAVRGGVDVPVALGSRSTYVPAGFGGFEGRRLRAGDRIPIGRGSDVPAADADARPAQRTLLTDDAPIRVIEASCDSALTREFREAFWAGDYTVSASSSRGGYRLERGSPSHETFTSGISEPTCVGAIQIPSGREAIVLMRDAPTVGGYPRIGVVASVDLGALAQRPPGSAVTFERISLAVAHDLLRSLPSLADIAKTR